MNEQNAFIRAIIADPDDDTVRLAFADWLQEKNDARCNFIYAQVKFDAWTQGRLSLSDSALKEIETQSTRYPPVPKGWEKFEPKWSRGMIEELTVKSGDLFENGKPRPFDESSIRHLRIHHLPPDRARADNDVTCEKVLHHPLMQRLESFGFKWVSVGSNYLSPVYEPSFTRLRELSVPQEVMGLIAEEVRNARNAGLNVLPELEQISDINHAVECIVDFPLVNLNAGETERLVARRRAVQLNPHWEHARSPA